MIVGDRRCEGSDQRGGKLWREVEMDDLTEHGLKTEGFWAPFHAGRTEGTSSPLYT